MDGWIVLRTSGRGTLRLAEHLASGGFEVWAPKRSILKRSPRRKATEDVEAPILPTFVFARARHVHAMLVMAEGSTKSRPDFSVFRQNGSVPVIDGEELAPLRFIEKAEADRFKRLKAKSRAEPFANGQVLRISSGSFAGLDCVVESDDGRFAQVSFGSFTVKISTFLLRNDMAESADIAA